MSDWQSRIEQAVTESIGFVSERSELSPVERFKFVVAQENMTNNPEYLAALTRVVDNESEVSKSEPDYWIALRVLCDGVTKSRALSNAVYRRLMQSGSSRESLIASEALNLCISLGRRLNVRELEELTTIRTHYLESWLNACVVSGHFQLVSEEVSKALSSGTINVKVLVMNLDWWFQDWRRNEDFFEVVRKFRDNTADAEGRHRLTLYLENRNADELQGPALPEPGSIIGEVELRPVPQWGVRISRGPKRVAAS